MPNGLRISDSITPRCRRLLTNFLSERREERRGSGKEKDQHFSRLPSSRPNWEGGWI